jgi:hypothetical protein
MGNMSYCRFENTYHDLVDCTENWSEEAGNERDERYRVRLLQLMKEMVESGEVDELLEEIEENKL